MLYKIQFIEQIPNIGNSTFNGRFSHQIQHYKLQTKG